ncbi:MAG: hypothetical protein O2949_10960, partial [Proteobacteria bacterium]|nr:hypothetical protein [Pseudomonadota bacterium]
MPFFAHIEQLQAMAIGLSNCTRNLTAPQWHPPACQVRDERVIVMRLDVTSSAECQLMARSSRRGGIRLTIYNCSQTLQRVRAHEHI